MQEVEPETWEQATRRLEGISTFGHLTNDQIPTELPYMFSSWEEYMNYLIDNLVPEEDGRETFRKQFQRMIDAVEIEREYAASETIKAVLGGDYYGTSLQNFLVSHRKKRREQQKKEKAK